jgi:hypothetical protein
VESAIWQAAERVLREYGAAAEEECASRASYHEMQGDCANAAAWRQTLDIIRRLRRGERPPRP